MFILGMPRSGTSLMEQILSSHPDVYGGGEFFFGTLQELFRREDLAQMLIRDRELIEPQDRITRATAQKDHGLAVRCELRRNGLT